MAFGGCPFTPLYCIMLYPEAGNFKPALVANSPVGWKEAFLCSIGFRDSFVNAVFVRLLSRIWLQIRKYFIKEKAVVR